MDEKGTNSQNKPNYKVVKLDVDTHRQLKMYAVSNDMSLGEAVKNLLEKVVRNDKYN